MGVFLFCFFYQWLVECSAKCWRQLWPGFHLVFFAFGCEKTCKQSFFACPCNVVLKSLFPPYFWRQLSHIATFYHYLPCHDLYVMTTSASSIILKKVRSEIQNITNRTNHFIFLALSVDRKARVVILITIIYIFSFFWHDLY